MTTVVLIASATPELARVAKASITRFNWPETSVTILPTNGVSFREHGEAMDSQRGLAADQVIMFDDDAFVTSPQWLPTLQRYHAEGYAVVGGIRSRGHVEQILVDGQIIPHAHCLSWTRKAWQTPRSLVPVSELDVPFLRYDTAVLATLLAGPLKALPFRPLHGRHHTHFRKDVSEYYDPEYPGETLWAHLMRGTSMAPSSRWREAVRSLTAVWSPRSRKIQRRQDLRAAFMARARELL